MKILSPYKDYYDFVQHQYGQAFGPTYVRTVVDVNKHIDDVIPTKLDLRYPTVMRTYGDDEYFIVVIAGRCFYVAIRPNDELFFPELARNRYQAEYDPKLLQFCKEKRQPVLLLEANPYYYSAFNLHNAIPKLSDYKIPSLLSPIDAYQSIDYFMTNLINDNPDMSPRTNMSDIEKLVSHGFDVRASFRHRR